MKRFETFRNVKCMPTVKFLTRLDLEQVSEDSAEILVSGWTPNTYRCISSWSCLAAAAWLTAPLSVYFRKILRAKINQVTMV